MKLSTKILTEGKEFIPWYEADLCDEAKAKKQTQDGQDVLTNCLICKQHVICSSGSDLFKQHFFDEEHLVLHKVELYPLAAFILR